MVTYMLSIMFMKSPLYFIIYNIHSKYVANIESMWCNVCEWGCQVLNQESHVRPHEEAGTIINIVSISGLCSFQNNVLLILWDCHTIYFDHIQPLSPTLPRFILHVTRDPKCVYCMCVLMCVCCISQICRSVVDLTRTTHLKKKLTLFLQVIIKCQ